VGKVKLTDEQLGDYHTVVAALVSVGMKPEKASLYADAYGEYRMAQENIRRLGPIVADPRTGSAASNPYLNVRDKAFQRLEKMHRSRAINVSFLWE